MDEVFEWLKAHYQYVLIAAGLLFLIGAIRDWKWMYQATVGDKVRHAFIFEVWGEKGYRFFYRNMWTITCNLWCCIFNVG